MSLSSRPQPFAILDILSSPNGQGDSALNTLSAADLGHILFAELGHRWQLPKQERLAGLILAQANDAAKKAAPALAEQIAQRLAYGKRLAATSVDRMDLSGFEALQMAQLRLSQGEGKCCLVGAFDADAEVQRPEIPVTAGANLKKVARDSLARWRSQSASQPKPWAQRTQDAWTKEIDFELVLSAATRLGVTKSEIFEYLKVSAARYNKAQAACPSELFAIHSRGLSLSEHPNFLGDKHLDAHELGQAPAARGGIGILLARSDAGLAQGEAPKGYILDIGFATLPRPKAVLAPLQAAIKILKTHKLSMADLDAIEIHEEFAPQVMAIWKASALSPQEQAKLGLGGASAPIPLERLNGHGGVQCQGNPKNAASLQLVSRLIRRLQERGGGKGLAMIGFRGGQGAALLLEC